MSDQTLQAAFKHGASARLAGKSRESCSYDDHSHACQWGKGWAVTDNHLQSHEYRKSQKIDRCRSEGRDASRAGKCISGCPYIPGTANEVAWRDAYLIEELQNGRTFNPTHRALIESMCPNVLYQYRERPGKSESVKYIQQIGRILRDPTKPEQEDTKMKSTLAYIFASMLPEVIGVKVAFAGPFDKNYTYKALKSQNIEVGGYVVVESPHTGLTVVKVTEVVTFDDLDPGAYQGYKWIIGTLAIADYASVTEKEKAFETKVAELQRKAKREQAVAALAEQVGGLAALQAIMAELAGVEAAPVPAPPAAGPAYQADPSIANEQG